MQDPKQDIWNAIAFLVVCLFSPSCVFNILPWSKCLENRCVICQMSYRRGDQQIKLPCSHVYHSECITRWLNINKVGVNMLFWILCLVSLSASHFTLCFFRSAQFVTLRYLVRIHLISINMEKKKIQKQIHFPSCSINIFPYFIQLFFQS